MDGLDLVSAQWFDGRQAVANVFPGQRCFFWHAGSPALSPSVGLGFDSEFVHGVVVYCHNTDVEILRGWTNKIRQETLQPVGLNPIIPIAQFVLFYLGLGPRLPVGCNVRHLPALEILPRALGMKLEPVAGGAKRKRLQKMAGRRQQCRPFGQSKPMIMGFGTVYPVGKEPAGVFSQC